MPDADGKVDAEASYITGGGPALNAAAAFAALGGRARLCSRLGAGPMAEWVRREVGGHGVAILDVAEGGREVLPVSSVILTGSRRAVVNQPLPPRGPEAAGELLDQIFADPPGIVLSDGHLPELAVAILRRAREAGVPTVLDGGSWKPWTAELLAWIDVAIVSSRFQPPAEDGLADPLPLLRRHVAAAAVTNGPGPIVWSTAGEAGELRPPAVDAVDTLGAGDIFHGAFCHAFARSADFAASLASAAEAAARACATPGPRRIV